MIIKARKLPPTQNDSARMRATAENGATLTIPYPHDVEDPYEHVVVALAKALHNNAPFSVSYRDGLRWDINGYATKES